MAPRHDAGFTLLELLVAIAIGGALLAATVQTAVQLQRNMESKLDAGGRDRIATVVLDRIERELVGSLLVVKPEDVGREAHPWLFLGTDGSYEGREADSLRFITETPSRAAQGAETPGYALVTYQTRQNEDGRLDLYRSEIPVPATLREIREDESVEAIDLLPAVRNIARFGLEFVEEENGQVQPAWDSSAEPIEDQLPLTVNITVQLFAASKGKQQLVPGEVLTRSVQLPVRPIGEGEEDDADCGDALSVDACVDRVLDQFPDLGSDERSLLSELAGDVQDQCFGTRGSPQLAALRAAIIELVGSDASEICGQ